MPTDYVCSRCSKTFWGEHPGYFTLFDKCRGKTCPDCGKERKLGRINYLHWDRTRFQCANCGEMTDAFFNGVCTNCFCEVQKEKGCVCPISKLLEKGRPYYCSFCEEFHTTNNEIICRECKKKQDTHEQKKEAFLKVGLPSMLGGVIIGFFLGWLFLVKLRKKKTKKT